MSQSETSARPSETHVKLAHERLAKASSEGSFTTGLIERWDYDAANCAAAGMERANIAEARVRLLESILQVAHSAGTSKKCTCGMGAAVRGHSPHCAMSNEVVARPSNNPLVPYDMGSWGEWYQRKDVDALLFSIADTALPVHPRVRELASKAVGNKATPHETKCVGWQPIDTAPKDGSRILAYFDYNPIYRESSERWFVAVVRWTGDYGMWSMPGTGGLSPKLWQPIRYPNDPTLKANEPLPISATGIGRDTYLKAWDTLPQADRDEWTKRGLG